MCDSDEHLWDLSTFVQLWLLLGGLGKLKTLVTVTDACYQGGMRNLFFF